MRVVERLLGLIASLGLGLALSLVACAPSPTPSPTAAPAKPTEKAAEPAAKPPEKAAEKAAPAAGPAVEIRIGHGFAAEEQLWLMAAKPEITPNQGKAYTLKFTAFRGNADRLSAYEAGQIDGGTLAAPSALFAAEQGVPFKLVASIVRESTGGRWHNTIYLANADAGLQSPKDLKDKTIGIVDFKSATELWARAAVESGGLNPETDVKYVVVPFPAMGEALRSRRIDVGAFPNPFYAAEKARGGVVEVFNAKTGVPFDEELLMLALQPDFVNKNQAAVKAFLADFVTATKWYLDNTRQARQELIDKKFVQAPPEVYLEMQDWFREPTGKIDVEGLDKLQDLHMKVGWQTKKVKLDEVVDQSLLP